MLFVLQMKYNNHDSIVKNNQNIEMKFIIPKRDFVVTSV